MYFLKMKNTLIPPIPSHLKSKALKILFFSVIHNKIQILRYDVVKSTVPGKVTSEGIKNDLANTELDIY